MKCEQGAVIVDPRSFVDCQISPQPGMKRQAIQLNDLRNAPGSDMLPCKQARTDGRGPGSTAIEVAVEQWCDHSDRLLETVQTIGEHELRAFCINACAVPAVKARFSRESLVLLNDVIGETGKADVARERPVSSSARQALVQALHAAWIASRIVVQAQSQ
jgi:hypothetical protein